MAADRCVEIHVALAEQLPGPAELKQAGELEEALIESAFRSRFASYQGNEFGGGEAVYVFDVRSIGPFLDRVQQILGQYGRMTGAYAVLDPGLKDEKRVPLDAVIDKSLIRPQRKRHSARIGDYYAVPLPNGRWGFAQYLTKTPGLGDLVQVLKPVADAPSVPLDELVAALPAFPPVLTWVAGCIEHDGWRYLGNGKKSSSIPLPPMRGSVTADQSGRAPGLYTDWVIRNLDPAEQQIVFIGTLTPDQRKLEYDRPWTGEEIATRIATSFNPDSLML